MSGERITFDKVLESLEPDDSSLPDNVQYLLRLSANEDFTLHSIDFTRSDDLSEYIRGTIQTLERYLSHPNSIPIPKKPHDARRKKSEINQIRESKLKQYQIELAVLKGKIMSPITIYSEDRLTQTGEKVSKIIGYSISSEVWNF